MIGGDDFMDDFKEKFQEFQEEEKTYTARELSELTGIKGSTCRRYLTLFSEFFLNKGGSRSKKYEVKAIEILKAIQFLYNKGYGEEEIKRMLSSKYTIYHDSEVSFDNDGNPIIPTTSPAALPTMQDLLNFREDLLEGTREILEEVIVDLERQNQIYIENIKGDFQRQLQEQLEQMEKSYTEKLEAQQKAFNETLQQEIKVYSEKIKEVRMEYDQQLEKHQKAFEEKLYEERKQLKELKIVRDELKNQDKTMKQMLEKISESQKKKGLFGWRKR